MTTPLPTASRRRDADPLHGHRHRFRLILAALVLGVLCGLLFGEYCAPLKFVGDAFIGLLRMAVLPFIVVSLICNLGRLDVRRSLQLVRVGGAVFLLLSAIGLLAVAMLPLSYPQWNAGSFFSTLLTEPPPPLNLVELFIPSNFFAALSGNQVPAVVVMCIFLGLALAGVENRHILIQPLDVLLKVLMRVNGFVARLTPVGIFAIAASTSGTITLDEAERLQAFLFSYGAGAFLLMLLVLPLLITCFTPFTYREVLLVSRDAIATAFATGKLIVVLPLLIEETQALFQDKWGEAAATTPAADVLYPLAYPFPHIGKLLAILFIPFASWFLGSHLTLTSYPPLLAAGWFSFFGGPLVAVPLLLNQTHLPQDMFQLFLMAGIVTERAGDALGAMHLTAFTLLTASVFVGDIRINAFRILKFAGVSALASALCVFALHAGLAHIVRLADGKKSVIEQLQLLEQPAPSVVSMASAPNPTPLLPGETLLQRIRRRGILRVGFNEDKLPFAYFNTRGELVGFDINMAHNLAQDLGVTIEFVRFDRKHVAEQLAADHFDIVMSGLLGTLERSERMQHTAPYLQLHLALVVPDYRISEFRSLDAIRAKSPLKIGFIDVSRLFAQRFRHLLPNAELVEIASNQAYFDGAWRSMDALLISAEGGSAFTVLYPDFAVVVPSGIKYSVPLFYAVGQRDAGMTDFLNYWISLRESNGQIQSYYEHWILGKNSGQQSSRRSLLQQWGWLK